MRAPARPAAVLLAGLLVALPLALGPTILEYRLLDLRLFLASQLAPREEAARDVAVILKDGASERALGIPQGPEWRRFDASLVGTLVEAGAAAVVFDAEFAAASAWDRDFGDACERAGIVVAAEITPGGTLPALAPSFAGIGDASFDAHGGRPRWISLPATPGARAPLAAVAVSVARPGAPPPAGGRLAVSFDYPVGAIPAFSYHEVLDARDGRVADAAGTPLSVFQDRIVLIGKDMPWEGDRFAFPHTLGRSHPGVYGHVYAVTTLLGGTPLGRVPAVADLLVAAATAVAVALLLRLRSRPVRVPAVAAVPLTVFVASTVLLARFRLWLGISGALAGAAGVLVAHWIAARIGLALELGRAVGLRPELIERFRAQSRSSGGILLKPAVVLCSDIRGYTRYVATHPPESVARVLAGYLEAMESTVTSRGGYINKYVGDEIVAVFGFPLAEEGAAERAVEAALAMLAELPALQARWRETGLPPVEAIGIGIDAGTLTFAEVGGAARTQFDIIGDAINGAARLQAHTKEAGTPLVISAARRASLDGTGLADRFAALGAVPIRGQGDRELHGLR